MRLPTSLLLLTVLTAAPALAQTATQTEDQTPYELKGLRFIHPILMRESPFIATELGLDEGVFGFNVKHLELGRVGRRDVGYFAYQQTLDFGVRFAPWIGASLSVQGAMFAGLNSTSLLLRTGTFNVNEELDVGVRVLHNERWGTQLTLRAFGGLQNGKDFSILQLLQAVIQEPGATLDSIVDSKLREQLVIPTHESSLGGGAFLAQKLIDHLGLQFALRFENAWRTEEPADIATGARLTDDSNYFIFSPTLGLQYDFVQWVPIALTAEYRYEIGSRSGTTYLNGSIESHSVALGFYYSGARHLQLGLNLAVLVRGEPLIGFDTQNRRVPSDYVRSKYAQLSFRYVW